jgi:thioredoxin-dependent peroxiredoxin
MPPEEDRRLEPAVAELAIPDQYGDLRRLSDFRGRVVVLYFYPADATPGCTVEGKEFRDLYAQFTANECEVIGASVDSVESHRAFAEKHAFPFILLSDSNRELTTAFAVLRNGVAARSTFVLDRDLKVRRVFHEVTPRGHAQNVLNFVRTMLESHRMLGG